MLVSSRRINFGRKPPPTSTPTNPRVLDWQTLTPHPTFTLSTSWNLLFEAANERRLVTRAGVFSSGFDVGRIFGVGAYRRRGFHTHESLERRDCSHEISMMCWSLWCDSHTHTHIMCETTDDHHCAHISFHHHTLQNSSLLSATAQSFMWCLKRLIPCLHGIFIRTDVVSLEFCFFHFKSHFSRTKFRLPTPVFIGCVCLLFHVSRIAWFSGLVQLVMENTNCVKIFQVSWFYYLLMFGKFVCKVFLFY